MGDFRKKPVVIQAVQFCETNLGGAFFDDGDDLPKWLDDAIYDGVVSMHGDYFVARTLEGDHRGDIGDWIIRGVKGELYPCKPDIFEQTYDAVT
jgi:hypothetical protein